MDRNVEELCFDQIATLLRGINDDPEFDDLLPTVANAEALRALRNDDAHPINTLTEGPDSKEEILEDVYQIQTILFHLNARLRSLENCTVDVKNFEFH